MFLTTAEKLNANQETLERYQDLLEHELALVKKLRKKLEPVTRVRILGIAKTARVSRLLTVLRDNLITPEHMVPWTLVEAQMLLKTVRDGEKPLVTLKVAMDHYTVKRHPLTECFVLQVAE